MELRNRELVKNTLILGVGQLFPKIISLLLIPILTAFLTKSELGEVDVFTSYIGLLCPVITLEIHLAVFRFLLAKLDNNDKMGYISTSIIYILIASFIVLPIIFVILRIQSYNTYECFYICLFFSAEVLYTLLCQIVRGVSGNVRYSVAVIVYSVLNIAITSLTIILLKMGYIGVIISFAVSYYGACIYMFFGAEVFKWFNIRRISFSALHRLLCFSFPILPSSIALWVTNLSDRVIIKYTIGAVQNGIYAVANKTPLIYNSIFAVFSLSWVETAARVMEEGNAPEYYSQLFQKLYRIVVGSMLVMVACTPAFYYVFVNGDYDKAMYQVPFLYVGVFFYCFLNYYSGIYLALKKTRSVGISSAIGAGINIVINIMLIERIGLYAASISTAISFFAITSYRAYDVNKHIHIDYDLNEIVVGLLFFMISNVLLYMNSFICIMISISISIIYNVVYNRDIIKKVALEIKLRKKKGR